MMLAFLKKVFWWLVCFELILEVRCGDKKSDKEEQRLPTTRDKDSSRKKPLPDLNLPGRKSDYLSNSYDSKAHRIGSRLFKKGDFPSLNEAVSSTKMLLAEKRKKSNLKYAQKKKSLGIKPKNYHKPDYNSKSSRIKRKAQTILDDDNGISDPIVANQMADKFLKERNRTKKPPQTHDAAVAINSPEHNLRVPLLASIEGLTGSQSSPSYHATSPKVKAPTASNDAVNSFFQSPKSKQPGYNSRANIVRRKARIIYHSGSGYSPEDSLKLAHQELTEKRRTDSKRRREKEKAGILKSRPPRRRDGYSEKEKVIGRKLVQLLEEDNHIVRHDEARKAAVEWYKASGRARSSLYRARKKEALAAQVKSNSSNDNRL